MLSLIDPTTIPPGGFKLKQKETGVVVTGASFMEFLSKVRNYRLANNLPLPLEWKSNTEHEFCEGLPPGLCRHIPGIRDYELSPVDRAVSLAEVLSGVKVIGAWMFKGFSKISQDEADARSKICAACPYNVPAEGCTTCSSNVMREAVEGVLGKSRTVAHDQLHVCNVCGCSLKVAVWCPQDLLRQHPSPNAGTAPDWCWKK